MYKTEGTEEQQQLLLKCNQLYLAIELFSCQLPTVVQSKKSGICFCDQ